MMLKVYLFALFDFKAKILFFWNLTKWRNDGLKIQNAKTDNCNFYLNKKGVYLVFFQLFI